MVTVKYVLNKSGQMTSLKSYNNTHYHLSFTVEETRLCHLHKVIPLGSGTVRFLM
jgi:hypothetical protein